MSLTDRDTQCRNLIEKHSGEVRLICTRLCERLTAEEREEILSTSGDEQLCRTTVQQMLKQADLRRLQQLQREHDAAVEAQQARAPGSQPAVADPVPAEQTPVKMPSDEPPPAVEAQQDDETDHEIDIADGDPQV